MTSSIRILIADDHPALTEGLRGLLEIEPDLKVIGQANNVADVIHDVHELKPDILLLDLKMPSQPKAEISPEAVSTPGRLSRAQVPSLKQFCLQQKWRRQRLLRPSS